MTAKRWRGLIAYEGRPTVDGRLIMPGALQWSDQPLPLLGALASGIVGSILHVERVRHVSGDAIAIMARGRYIGDAEPGTTLAVGIDALIRDTDGGSVVTAAELQAATVGGSAPAWPDAQVTILAADDTSSGDGEWTAPDGSTKLPEPPPVG